MKRWIKKLLKISGILFVLGVSLVSFLISTTPGLYLTLKVLSYRLPGALQIEQLQGRLLDDLSLKRLSFDAGDDHIQIEHLKLHWDLREVLRGHPVIELISAEAVNYQDTSPEFHIERLKSFLTLKPGIDLNVKSLNVKSLTIKEQRIKSLRGSLRTTAQKIQNADLTGFINQHKAHVFFSYDTTPYATIEMIPLPRAPYPIRASFKLDGSLEHLHWKGHFGTMLTVQGQLKNLSRLQSTVEWCNLRWNRYFSPNGILKLAGTLPELKMDWDVLAAPEQQKPWHSKGTINGSFSGNWVLQSRINGTLFTSLPVAADVNAKLTPKALSGMSEILISQDKKINLRFSLPKFQLSQWDNKNQPFTTDWTAHIERLDFLQALSPDLGELRGVLDAHLHGQGTMAAPEFTTRIDLTQARATLPKLDLKLAPIDLHLTAANTLWQFHGTIASNQQPLHLDGKGRWRPEIEGNIQLQGQNIPIANTDEYQIRVNPALVLGIKPSDVQLTGTIHVPYALVKPQTFTNTLTLPDDVVFKAQTSATEDTRRFNPNMNISVTLGDRIELSLKGLHAFLAGQVTIRQTPQSGLLGSGELRVTQGEYKAFGQTLKVEQGELLFNGGRLDNPSLNLRAAKTVNASGDDLSSVNPLVDFNSSTVQNLNLGKPFKVGVEVSGKINAPKIQLFSVPSILSQADILSMLVLGQPASQASKAGGQLLLSALTSMNLGTGTSGAQLIDQLRQTIGIDFNMQTTTNYNQNTRQFTESRGFVVGKKLSNRIYLSYNVGMTQTDPNVLTLKYLLSKLFSIQVSSSDTSSGIDLMYTASKQRKP